MNLIKKAQHTMPCLRLLRIERERNEVLCFDVGIGQVISGQDTPYIVKWTGGSDDSNLEFHDVTIKGTQGGSTGSMYVDFVGSFSPVALEANDRSVFYLGAANTLYYPSASMTIGSCRAYFQLHNGITVGNLSAEAPIRLNFGDDDQETGIREISTPSNPSNPYITLDGRRLKEMPTTRGIYIVNGKKIIVK